MKKQNKKGAIGIVIFFGVLFLILIIGFMASLIVGIVGFASDEITPIMFNLGVVGATNFSEISEFTFTKLNIFIQALPWIMGFSYVVALIGSIFFALSFKTSANPIYIGLYIMFIILLILGSIIISNMYENIFTQNNVMGDRLKDQTLMSYMILYSPTILTIIAFITGIYLFAGRQNEGGFNV